MKKHDSIWTRIGRSLKRGIKNYVRGMPEEKIYIKPAKSNYVHISKKEKNTGDRKYIRRRRKSIVRKEMEK